MPYHDLHIRLTRTALREAECSMHSDGGVTEDITPVDVVRLRTIVAPLRGDSDEALTPGESRLRELGTELRSELFGAGNVSRHWDRCLGVLSHEGKGVRVRLWIQQPELSAIPWEFVFDRLNLSSSRGEHIAVSTLSPMVRFVPGGRRLEPLAVSPLRMLVVAPEGTGLDFDTEIDGLKDSVKDLQERKLVEVHYLRGRVTLKRLGDVLAGTDPTLGPAPFHVFHFMGHGAFVRADPGSAAAAEGGGAAGHEDEEIAYLWLNHEDGSPAPVDHESLSSMLLNQDSVQLVVLNCCEGGTVSETTPALGMAPRLAERGVPAVVAMQYAIRDLEAVCFADTFYKQLFRGRAAGDVLVALTLARNALQTKYRGARALGAPVLYLNAHAEDAYLFTVPPDRGSRIPKIPLHDAAAETLRTGLEHQQRAIGSARARLAAKPGDELLHTGLRHAEQTRDRIRRRLWMRDAVIVMLLAGAALSGGASQSLFNGRDPEQRLKALAPGLQWSRPREADDVTAIMQLTRELPKELRRHELAGLIGRLAQVEARVVVFATSFDSEGQRGVVLAAIVDAERNGTRVVLGDSARMPRMIAEARAAGVTPAWGATCFRKDVWMLWKKSAAVPVVFPQAGSSLVPSVAAAAVAAYRGTSIVGIDQDRRVVQLGDSSLLRYSEFAGIEEPGGCGFMRNRAPAAYAYLAVGGSRHVIIPYPDSAALIPRLRGKIVVVVLDSTARVHADAIHTLLTNSGVQPLSPHRQGLLLAVVAGLGWALGFGVRKRRALWWGAVAAGASALYLGVAVGLQSNHMAPYVALHLPVLWIVYLASRLLRRRFSR